jgi:arsenite methyltransferase
MSLSSEMDPSAPPRRRPAGIKEIAGDARRGEGEMVQMANEQTGEQIRESVREHYAEAAKRAESRQRATCGCGGSDCGGIDSEARGFYDARDLQQVPTGAAIASLGCGNPTLLAELKPGETVLDLGSGGGIDVLLSAKRVGSTGKAYGLDMTDEMLALALANKARAGAENVEFLKGHIEAIPLPSNTVDVIISNCVINLSGDKRKVLAEAFRVLKPGGRFAVSDVVVRGEIPAEVRRNVELYFGCIAGALSEEDYRSKLAAVGFTRIDIEPTRIYKPEDAREFLAAAGLDVEAILPAVEGKYLSAFVRAVKPA